MKSMEEIINEFLDRNIPELSDYNKKAYNSFKSQLEGIWRNGYSHCAQDFKTKEHNKEYDHSDDESDNAPERYYDNDALLSALRMLIKMSQSEVGDVFGIEMNTFYDVLSMEASEIIEKYKAYEERAKLSAGDIVTVDTLTEPVVVTYVGSDEYVPNMNVYCLHSSGIFTIHPAKKVCKTGTRCDSMETLLNEIKEINMAKDAKQ